VGVSEGIRGGAGEKANYPYLIHIRIDSQKLLLYTSYREEHKAVISLYGTNFTLHRRSVRIHKRW
jgi:hypothetical protein